MLGADLFCSQARHRLTQPVRSGASAMAMMISSNCESNPEKLIGAPRWMSPSSGLPWRCWLARGGRWLRSSHHHQQCDHQGHEAIKQIHRDATLLQQAEQAPQNGRQLGNRLIHPAPEVILDLA